MGFQETSEGRVFFQNSNNNEAPGNNRTVSDKASAQDEKVPPQLSTPSEIEKSLDAKSSQLQVLALLRSLNDRLRSTQEERDQFRKDLDDYRQQIENLGQQSEKSDQAFSLLEEKLKAHQKRSEDSLKQAEKKAEDAAQELEEAREKLEELEDKASATDRRLRDQILQKGQAEQDFKKEYEDLRSEQEALKALSETLALAQAVPGNDNLEAEIEKALEKQGVSKIDDFEKELHALEQSIKNDIKADLEATKQSQEELSEKVDKSSSKTEQLDRKLEKAIQDRARMVRKIERLEETVIQTHEALNAKALVLLTDRNIATQTSAPQIEASVDIDASGDNVSNIVPAQKDLAGANTVYDERPVWQKSSAIKAALVGSVFVFGIIAGWGISQLPAVKNTQIAQIGSLTPQSAEFPGAEAPDITEAPSPASFETLAGDVYEPASEQILQVKNPFQAQDDIADLALDAETNNAETNAALDYLPADETLNEMMANQQEELAEQLNALEPSAIDQTVDVLPQPDVEKTVAVTETSQAEQVHQDPVKQVKAAPKISEPSVQAVSQRIASDPNLPESVQIIETRALNGEAEAQHDLAAIYTAGHAGVEQNYERAAIWFREAAQGGIANARYNLGVLHHQGIGLEQNVQEAIRWYDSAAKLGHPEAQYNLGIAYVEGVGVAYDPKQAAMYFQQAATQGIMEAAYNLGLIYENGLLGAPEPDRAIAWYKKASDLGSPEATTALQELANNLGRNVEDINRLASQVDLSANITDQKDTNSTLEFQRRITSRIQGKLMDLGLYPGPADGINGQRTQDAIRSYQASHDLIVDGRVSRNLLNHMLITLDET